MPRKQNLSVFWTPSIPMIIGIVSMLVVQIASVVALGGGLDVTQSNVRVFCLVASVLITVFFVVMVIYRHNRMRGNYLEGYISDYSDEIEYVGSWTGTVLFLSLSILLAVVHFRNTVAGAFDPLINVGNYARLIAVVGGYYMASLVWLIAGFFIHFTAKGAEERRRFAEVS